MSRVKDEASTLEEIRKLPIIGKQPENEREENFLREVCEFEFYNLEEPGISIKFPYGNTKRRHNFTFFHGGKYKLPRFIARHLDSCTTPIWKWKPDGSGSLRKERVGTKPRFQMRETFGG